MIELKIGKVIKILAEDNNIIRMKVKSQEQIHKTILYKKLLGDIKTGDQVIINTTATSLSLGTGGYDFVVCNLNKKQKIKDKGHIMKLRYTPYQFKVCSVAEQTSAYQQKINKFVSLNQTPVIVGELHSMLPAIVSVLKESDSDLKITYIMTDGGALPLDFSNLVSCLKKRGLINETITIGHSFGGDLEAVNIYAALIAAYQIHQADVIIVIMGPGIVGTGTKYAFSGTEQANILHAAKILGATTIAIPRISFQDFRERHFGLSHHTQTILGELTLLETKVAIPILEDNKASLIKSQLERSNIENKHKIFYRDSAKIIDDIKQVEDLCNLMGRSYRQEKEYFWTCGISGLLAKEIIEEENRDD